MEFLEKAWAWISGPYGLAIFVGLLAISEALGVIEKVESNSIYQFIKKGLVWIVEKIRGVQK